MKRRQGGRRECTSESCEALTEAPTTTGKTGRGDRKEGVVYNFVKVIIRGGGLVWRREVWAGEVIRGREMRERRIKRGGSEKEKLLME